jgi:hypothetical protein
VDRQDFELRVAAHHPVIISNEPSAIYMLHTHNFYARSSDYRLSLSGSKLIINRMMSDGSLSLDTRIQIKNRLKAWIDNTLIALAERASLKGEFDDVPAIAEILTRSCNKKAKALLLVGPKKLKESSEPAYFLVSWVLRLLRFIFPLNIINKIKLKQLQRKYGGYLRYLDT